jgi:ribose transport system substrate-binding protein
MSPFNTPRLRGLALLAMAALAAVAIAACGSSSSDSGSSSSGGESTSAESGGPSSSEVVKQAEEVVAKANGKLVYSKKGAPETAAEIEPYGEWKGPTSAPKPKSGITVAAVVCTQEAVTCVRVGEGVKEAGEALGWNVELVNASAPTPEGWATAFNSALAANPDAIIGISVPSEVVSDKLEEAKKKGIVTVGVAEPEHGTGYESAISTRQPFEFAVTAFGVIAESKGDAQIVGMDNSDGKVIQEAVSAFGQVIELCESCSFKTVNWTFPMSLDPTKSQAVVSGLLRTNPDANYLEVPYSAGIQNTLAAVRSLGDQGKVKVVTKDADELGLQAVSNGEVVLNAGVPSLKWLGWAAMDNVNRALDGKPMLSVGEQGLPVVLYEKSNVPSGNDAEKTPGIPDFAAKYSEVWGVG